MVWSSSWIFDLLHLFDLFDLYDLFDLFDLYDLFDLVDLCEWPFLWFVLHGPPSSMWALPATGEDESYTVSVHKASGQQARGRYRMTEISAPYLQFGSKNIFD